MRPSSLGGAAYCVALCLSVCLSVPLSSVTSRHLANYNDTCTFQHALRAAYRTAISAAQILVLLGTQTEPSRGYVSITSASCPN